MRRRRRFLWLCIIHTMREMCVCVCVDEITTHGGENRLVEPSNLAMVPGSLDIL